MANDLLIRYALNNVQASMPVFNRTYIPPKHLKPVTDELNAILSGGQRKICISLPPRHGKTETLLAFIALYIYKYPQNSVGYLSHTQTFAESKALKSQNYCKFLGVPTDARLNNRKEFRTAEGGGLYTSGIHGDIMGRGFNLVVIDDPVASRAEAESATYRNKTWDCFIDSIESRLEPSASVIVVMTRWHVDDLIGRILKHRSDYRYIRIPALCDDLDDLLNRELGEALWSERYDRDYLVQLQKQKPYSFASMYQGIPQVKGSQLFKDAYFYNELPDSYTVTIGADLAYSDKVTSDYSAVVVTAQSNAKYYILDVVRWQSDINESIKKLQAIQSRYNVPINLEDNGVQKGVYDFVGKYVKLQPVKIKSDKYVRSLPTIDKWNGGQILLPMRASWLNQFIDEVTNFTGVKDLHDDVVDALNYSIKEPMGVYVNY